MRDLRYEELLSSYLDGELSLDQRQAVEQRLSDEEGLRQLFEQLQRQRELLRSLPRWPTPANLADNVVERIRLVGKPLEPLPGERSNRRGWRITIGVVTAIAAGLLIALLLRQPGQQGPGGSLIAERGPTERPSPEDVPGGSSEDIEPALPVDQLALNEFQRSVPFFLVLDLTVSPQGQSMGIFEQTLMKAGIEVDGTVRIAQRLEQDLLGSRFFGDDKLAAVGDEPAGGDQVEMYFVRAKARQIDVFQRELNVLHYDPAGLVKRRMDMAVGTKELEIFLRLNDATDPPASGLARAESWKKPAGYKLQFRFALRSLSLPRWGAISAPITPELVPADGPPKAPRISFEDLARAAQGVKSAGSSAAGEKSAAPLPVAQSPASTSAAGGSAQQAELDQEMELPAQLLIIVRNLK